MKASLKSEIKKILTTRATYGLSLFFLVLVVFVSFYVEGFRHTSILTDTTGPLAAAQEKVFVAGTLTQIASIISIAGALIGLLLVANEYRYNTIVYTFSSSKSRSTVLVSKIIAVLGYVFCYSLLSTILALLLIHLGIAASGHSLPLQQIHNLNYITKSVVYSEGFALAGILFAVVIRNQISNYHRGAFKPTT
jgi:ABC-type transport system involved in multi-copper enzyme maturation permease subunit